MKILKTVKSLVQYNWKALVGFQVIFKLMTVVLIIPLVGMLVSWVMDINGLAYLTGENIGDFIRKPETILLLLCLLMMLVTYTMIDISAVIFMLDQSAQKEKVHLLQVFRFSINNAIRVWKPENFLLILLVLLLTPFMNIGIISGFVTTISIPEVVIDYIYTNQLMSVLFSIGMVLLTGVMMKWIYAFHYFTLEGCTFRQACKQSRQLSQNRTILNFITMFLVQLIYSLVYLLFVLLAVALVTELSRMLESWFVLEWIMSTLIWFVLAISLAVASFLTMPLNYSCISALFYQQKVRVGEKLIYSGAPKYTQNKYMIRLIHGFNLILGGMILTGSLVLGYLVCSGAVNPQIEYMRRVEITAHRGASAYYPENTMPAFRGAKEMGADWIELDVQQSKDGQIFVFHDTNFKRVTGYNARTWNLTYKEIAQLDAGSHFSKKYKGERIPLFRHVLAYAKENGVRLNIELKPTGNEIKFVPSVVNEIRAAGMQNACVITSQVYRVLEEIKAYDTSITTVYVMSFAYGRIDRLAAADHFSIKADSATGSLVSRIHRAGSQFYVWTVNTKEQIDQMIDLGVDNIITDDIWLAKECVYDSQYSSFMKEYIQWFQ